MSTMKLSNKDLKKMSKFFLQNYFDNIPVVTCKFMPNNHFADGESAYFMLEESDDYNSENDELFGQGEYATHYVEIDDGVGFSCGGGSFADPLNHPDVTIALKDELKIDILKCIGTLLHELAHYYCWYVGYEHHDGSREFENKLKELGLPSNYNNNFNKEIKKWEDSFDYSCIQHYYDEYIQSL